MASVLGASRGAGGGLSGQLKCKSQRRRRRSKRKGKDPAFCAVSADRSPTPGVGSACSRGPLSGGWGGSAPSRAPEFASLCGGPGGSCRLRGDRNGGGGQRARAPHSPAGSRVSRGSGCGDRRTVPSPPHIASDPLRGHSSTRAKGNTRVSQQPQKREQTSCQLLRPNRLGGRSGQDAGDHASKLADVLPRSARCSWLRKHWDPQAARAGPGAAGGKQRLKPGKRRRHGSSLVTETLQTREGGRAASSG